jgi:hypothetical protein
MHESIQACTGGEREKSHSIISAREKEGVKSYIIAVDSLTQPDGGGELYKHDNTAPRTMQFSSRARASEREKVNY